MDLKTQNFSFAGNFVDRENVASIKARQHFGVMFQPAKIVKLPGLQLFSVGKKFVPGASLEAS